MVKLVAADSVPDYAVAVAVAIAGGSTATWLPVLASDGDLLPAAAVALHEQIGTGRLVDPGMWATFQRLWHRWQAPLDHVSPMRWYLAALATATGVDAASLSRQVDEWLQLQATLDLPDRAAHLAGITGLGSSGDPVVATGDPLGALAAMLTAAIEHRPFLWLTGDGGAADAAPAPAATLAALSHAAVSPRARARAAPAPGLPRAPVRVPLGRLALTRWQALTAAERNELLEDLHDRLAILGPVRVDAAGLALDNHSGLDLVLRCAGSSPESWSYHALVFVTTLWLVRLSAVNFTELNQTDLDFTGLEDFLRRKHARYRAALGDSGDEPAGSAFDVAAELPGLRCRVEEGYVRCFEIEGGSWERREHLLSARRVRADAIPAAFADHVTARVGVALPGGGCHRERLDGLVERMSDEGVNPAQALVAIADYVLRDEVLRPDYAVLTAARGLSLDEPWTLELTDVFSYVTLRGHRDWRERGVRLADVQIRNAIAQRMRYNVTRRARNYSPQRSERLRAQPFQFPDVASMEDAHHGGHRASGIRCALRAPFLLQAPGDACWRGLADLRINRVSHSSEDRYSLRELPRLIRYSLWCKAIVEATYARGLLLDDAYGRKLAVSAAQDADA